MASHSLMLLSFGEGMLICRLAGVLSVAIVAARICALH